MKISIPIVLLTTALLLVFIFFIYALDNWLGILAYKYSYIGSSILIAAIIALVWRVISKKVALLVSLAAFALLMTPLMSEAPSSRILREVMIDLSPGTAVGEVEPKVKQAYLNTRYAMPQITQKSKSIDVSLLTQEEGDCTSVLFHIQDGIVIGSTFMPD